MEMLAISRIRDTEIATTPRIWKYKRITLFIFIAAMPAIKKQGQESSTSQDLLQQA